MLLNYYISCFVLGSLCVGKLGAAGFQWCPYCRLKPATWTPLKPNSNELANTQRTENKTTDVVIQQHSASS